MKRNTQGKEKGRERERARDKKNRRNPVSKTDVGCTGTG
jgi:hypothetical protein